MRPGQPAAQRTEREKRQDKSGDISPGPFRLREKDGAQREQKIEVFLDAKRPAVRKASILSKIEPEVLGEGQVFPKRRDTVGLPDDGE